MKVQWRGLGAFVAKNRDVTSWHKLLYELNQFSMFCNKFHAVTKRSQMHRNTVKQTETLVRVHQGGLGAFVVKNPNVTSRHQLLH